MYSVNEPYDVGTVPAFLKKLWTLVEDPSTDELICWGHNGTSFHVYDQSRFAREVLPLYFKHSNIASFIRQLNMYGFRKVVGVETGSLKVEKDDLEFHHPYFLQGHEELLENIKRKVSPGVKLESVRLKQEDVSKVLSDVCSLRGKQESISAKMDSLKRENEVLWREVASLRQKHIKQQQIVNKLIQFLVTLVRGNREIPTKQRKRVMPLMLNDASQIAAKQPKLSRQLSIEEKSKPYTVHSPPSTEVTFTPPQSTGPIIHDVTDTLADSLTETLAPPSMPRIDPSELSPIEILNDVTESTDLTQEPSPVTVTTCTTPGQINISNAVTKTSSMPTSTIVNQTMPLDKKDVSEQLDVLQTDIEELKDLLSGGQYNLDSSMLLGLFNPESPLPSVSDLTNEPQQTATKADNPGAILGNELIQYEPQDDLSTFPLFDLGDTALTLPGLEESENNTISDLPLESQEPKTEVYTPIQTPVFPEFVKQEKLD